MENLSGQTIKGYELRGRIGSGDFGAVYQAYQATLGREQRDTGSKNDGTGKEIGRPVEGRIVIQVPTLDYWRFRQPEPDVFK